MLFELVLHVRRNENERQTLQFTKYRTRDIPLQITFLIAEYIFEQFKLLFIMFRTIETGLLSSLLTILKSIHIKEQKSIIVLALTR